jgi:hypothetical protein
MSQVALSGNVSGTGTFTIAAPNSNTDRTLSLPDQTGTLLTGSGALNINASAPTSSLTLDASGQLGIGTSSPINLLTVQTAATGTTAGSNVIARLQSNASGRDATLQFSDNVANSVTISMLSGATVFRQNGTESARLGSGGNFLVATTTSPQFNRTAGNGFEVIAGGEVQIANDNNCLALNRTNTSDGDVQKFFKRGTQTGQIVVTNTTTAYQTSSDYRLKHDIQPMTGALAKVQQLKPVTYKWNADDSQSQGFIAHELQEVVPECVTGEKDAVDAEGKPQYQGIDTSFLVATLTAAIQELKDIVDQQAQRIAALEGASNGVQA